MKNVQAKLFASILLVAFGGVNAQENPAGSDGGSSRLSQSTELDSPRSAFAKLPDSVVVVEGPYTLKDSFSVHGYVIERKSPKVKFRPCTGEDIEVEESLLEKAAAGCEGEAPDHGNPVTVACVDIPMTWGTAMGDILSNANSDKIGAIYRQTFGGGFAQIPSDDGFAAAKFADVKTIQSCGGVLLGLSVTGAPIAGIVAVEPSERSN